MPFFIINCFFFIQESLYGRPITLAYRETVESDDNEILNEAKDHDVALLVVGDPFGATTHSDLFLRATQSSIKVKVIHNASILTAVACCGLQLYSFGEVVSIPFWDNSWKPDSFFEKIIANKKSGLHTLCLLDIKVREKSIENMIKNREIYEKPRFMSVAIASQQLLQIIKSKKESNSLQELDIINENTNAVGLARIGSDSQKICYSSLESMASIDLGPPLHSLIIPATLHPLEEQMLQLFKQEIR